MPKVTAVFDIGRTNKKLLFFSTKYKVVLEETKTFPDIRDSDGDPCDDIETALAWLSQTLLDNLSKHNYSLSALNFTTYGATLVHLGENGQPLSPPYSYLKPLGSAFSEPYFREPRDLAVNTASPPMENLLNSGVQLYWLQQAKKDYFAKIRTSLHLPQYLSYRFTGLRASDFTSVGCHTGLWDFYKQDYADPVQRYGWSQLLPKPQNSGEWRATPDASWAQKLAHRGKVPRIGLGLHDSSASLVPYQRVIRKPFLLFSTGTWGVALNPGAKFMLTKEDAARDCLYFLTPEAQPVRAARIFLGAEHDEQCQRIATHFGIDPEKLTSLKFNPQTIKRAVGETRKLPSLSLLPKRLAGTGPFPQWNKEGREWDLSRFASAQDTYTQLLVDLAVLSAHTLRLAEKAPGLDPASSRTPIYVDGGFARNQIFLHVLACLFPWRNVVAAQLPQSTALGAALVMKPWSPLDGPQSLPSLTFRRYAPDSSVVGLLAKYAEGYLQRGRQGDKGPR